MTDNEDRDETSARAMRPEDVPNELVTVAAKAIQAAHARAGSGPRPEFWEEVRIGLAAVLPQYRQQIASEVEAHAESIGWYEAGGVWAEAIDVIKQEQWTRREATDG